MNAASADFGSLIASSTSLGPYGCLAGLSALSVRPLLRLRWFQIVAGRFFMTMVLTGVIGILRKEFERRRIIIVLVGEPHRVLLRLLAFPRG